MPCLFKLAQMAALNGSRRDFRLQTPGMFVGDLLLTDSCRTVKLLANERNWAGPWQRSMATWQQWIKDVASKSRFFPP